MIMKKGRSTSSGVIETIVGDAVCSFCNSTVDPLMQYIKPHHGWYIWLVVSTTLYRIIDVGFPLNKINPASMLSTYAAGKGDDTLLYLVLRSILQVIGFCVGSVMKEDTASLGAGGKGRLSLDNLAITEVAISFTSCFFSLYLDTIDAGPSGNMLKDWLFTFMILFLFEVFGSGEELNLNPASQFGEDFVKDHISWEYHFFMYWFCPLIGAVIAGWTFRVFVMIKRISRVILSTIVWLRM